jgi:hypothetical protein
MEYKTDFSKCRHFNTPKCPGQNLESITRASKAIIVDSNGKNIFSTDMMDFIKAYGCPECKKFKEPYLNLSNRDT